MIIGSPCLSGLRSQTHFSDFAIKFFLSSQQSDHFWNLITHSSTYDFSPTREAQLLDTAVVYVLNIPLGLVSEQAGMIYFNSTS